MAQESHGFYSVGGNLQVEAYLGIAQGFSRQQNVAGTVFYQKNFNRQCVVSQDVLHISPHCSGRLKLKVEPFPGSDCTQSRPPWRSTIFLLMANPMPVPENSSRACKRWNMTKIRSKYCEAIPIPLSRTEKVNSFSFFAEKICMQGISGP